APCKFICTTSTKSSTSLTDLLWLSTPETQQSSRGAERTRSPDSERTVIAFGHLAAAGSPSSLLTTATEDNRLRLLPWHFHCHLTRQAAADCSTRNYSSAPICRCSCAF